MPRPADHYTHQQFEPVDSDFNGETVRCTHCKTWTGSVKTLNRKKDHLTKCELYAAWRAAGNGQDLAPPNRYNKRDSTTMNDSDVYGSPYNEGNNNYAAGAQLAPTMSRNKIAGVAPLSTPQPSSLLLPPPCAARRSIDQSDVSNDVRAADNVVVQEGATPAQLIQANVLQNTDLSKYYDEFWDDEATQKVSFADEFLASPYDEWVQNQNLNANEKRHDSHNRQCMRSRCKYCGSVRAKNTTRQYEHLQACNDFHSSTEGQQALADGSLQQATQQQTSTPTQSSSAGRKDIWRGGAPNPNLMINRPNRNRGGRPSNNPQRQVAAPPLKVAPSLVNHLLTKNRTVIEEATQMQFLSHAGCGTLSPVALQQWLTQQGHMARAIIPFIGGLISKIQLADAANPQADSSWRSLDLLISTLNNAKRELEFLRSTQTKYGLQRASEQPKYATKGICDLFNSAGSGSSSLLEGMVVLWAVEHLYCVSWQYASNFIQPNGPSSTSYTLPSYLDNPSQPGSYYALVNTNNNQSGPSNTHISALHEALIPNWTSPGFSKFVEACKASVDELANNQTSGNGASELNNCELVFKQIVWLWRQTWPDVTGMGEEKDVSSDSEGAGAPGRNGGDRDAAIEIEDGEDGGREDAPVADSPYGGTGLGAIAAANRIG